MKLLKYIIGICSLTIGLIIAFGYAGQNLVSSLESKKLIISEFKAAIGAVGYPDAQVDLDEITWGGVFHPLSIHVDKSIIRDNDKELVLTDLVLGVGLLGLVAGRKELKHVAVRDCSLFFKDKAILGAEFEIIHQVNRVAIRVNRLAADVCDLSYIHPVFTPLRGVNCHANIEIAADYNFKEISRGVVKVSLGEGSIVVPPFYPNKTPIQQAKFEVKFTPSKIALTQCTIKTQDAFAQIYGAIKGRSVLTDLRNGAEVTLNMQGNLDRLPVDQINVYWPQGLAPKPRHWVTTNLSKGEATNAIVHLKGKLKLVDQLKFEVVSLSGNIDAKGVDVAYLGNLPKITNTSGHCQYTKSNFVIDAQGTCEGMTVKNAHLDISQLDQETHHIDIDLEVEGGVKPALSLISQKPLQLPQKLGLNPDLFEGEAKTHLLLSFPLSDTAGLDSVSVKSTSIIKNAQLIHPKLNQIMSQGDLNLSVSNNLLSVDGTAVVFGHPAEIKAHKNLKNDDRSLIVDGKDTKNDPNLGAFFMSFSNGRVSGYADLTKIAYDIPIALFMKEGGEKGALNFSGQYENDVLTLSDWDLVFGSARATGMAVLNPDKEQEITLKQAKIGELIASAQIRVHNKEINVNANLDKVDLDHVFHHYSTDESPSNWSVTADLNVKKMILSDKINFGPSKIIYTDKQGDLTSLKIQSNDPGKFEVYISPEQDHLKSIMLSCDNAGDILDYFMPNNDFEGGSLNLVGQLSGQPGERLFKAEVDLRDFVAVKAPVLAQIISLSSLDGILRTLSGQGVSFSNTIGRLEVNKDQVTLRDIHASGPSIALTLNGTVNLVTDNVAIEGELFPVNSVNMALSYIPLLGTMLGGSKNRGIISTAFRVRGKRQDPVITANPLSTIAPQSVKDLYNNRDKDAPIP